MLQLSAVLVVAIGLVLLGLYGFGVITEAQLASFMGIIVAGGFAGFRNAIESTGFKTYIVAGAMLLFGLLHQAFGAIPLDKFLVIEGVLTGLGVATLVHASAKSGLPSAANKIL